MRGCVHFSMRSRGVVDLAEEESDLGGVRLGRALPEIRRQCLDQRRLLLDEESPELAQLGDAFVDVTCHAGSEALAQRVDLADDVVRVGGSRRCCSWFEDTPRTHSLYDALQMTLHLDAEQLNTCVACGLCLPHCPTYRVTGEEALSPRGRIDAMRGVQLRGAPVDADFVSFMSTCVQCRGCEPACPSGVQYGQADRSHPSNTWPRPARITPRWQRFGLSMLPRHRSVAGRVDGVGARPAGEAGAETVGARSFAGPPRAGGAAERWRRVAVHGVCDGRLATRYPPLDGAGARRVGCHLRRSRPGRWLLWRPARPCRVASTRRSSWRPT